MCGGGGRVPTDLTAALDLRRELLRGRAVVVPGEAIRVSVHPTLAHLVTEEDPDLLSDVETSLGVRIEILPDDRLPAASWEIHSD